MKTLLPLISKSITLLPLIAGGLLLASLTLSAADEYGENVPAPTEEGISYGEDERHVMDLWLAKGEGARPLVLHIHSGGWCEGSKERLGRVLQTQELLDAGISVASINYRLIPRSSVSPEVIDSSTAPLVHTPLHDARRALQFLRHNAAKWNLDAERVGLAGGSAGGCSSLWLAYHPEMADPNNADPVLRKSTRVTCAAVIAAQTTLDPVQGRKWIPDLQYGAHAFGLSSVDDAISRRKEIEPWVQAYSPASLASVDDPPVYLFYYKAPVLGSGGGDATHSSNYGAGLKQICDKLNLGCDLMYQGAVGIKHPNATAYLISALSK